jgi:hypothetical protein
MAAGPRPEGRPKRRKMFLPPKPPIVIEQPPARLAHLSGDDLYEALIAPDHTERWYTARAAAECARETETFRGWVSHRYKYEEAVAKAKAEADRIGGRPKPVRRPKAKMTPKPDGYEVRSPWWWPHTMRRWFIQEELMDRHTGKAIPYKPAGRPPGTPNAVERKSQRPMQEQAAEVLAAFEKLRRDGSSVAEARAALANRYGKSEKQILRRVETARKLRAAATDLHVTADMSPTEIRERALKARELLVTDGRRSKNEDKIRDGVAVRLGVDRALVDHVLDGTPAEAVAVAT